MMGTLPQVIGFMSSFNVMNEYGWYSESVHLFHWGRWGLGAIFSFIIITTGSDELGMCGVYIFLK